MGMLALSLTFNVVDHTFPTVLKFRCAVVRRCSREGLEVGDHQLLIEQLQHEAQVGSAGHQHRHHPTNRIIPSNMSTSNLLQRSDRLSPCVTKCIHPGFERARSVFQKGPTLTCL